MAVVRSRPLALCFSKFMQGNKNNFNLDWIPRIWYRFTRNPGWSRYIVVGQQQPVPELARCRSSSSAGAPTSQQPAVCAPLLSCESCLLSQDLRAGILNIAPTSGCDNWKYVIQELAVFVELLKRIQIEQISPFLSRIRERRHILSLFGFHVLWVGDHRRVHACWHRKNQVECTWCLNFIYSLMPIYLPLYIRVFTIFDNFERVRKCLKSIHRWR